MEVRVRFAPSPTGFLHIGSLRTVLFDYLIAKSLNGKLILRIEDTDQKRKVEGAEEKLIDILNWVGIEFDEGPHVGGDFGPYVQTQKLEIYNKYIQELIDKGGAYHCFCTEERLQELRNEQQSNKLPPRYDKKCRDLTKKEVEQKIANGEKFVIRQKMPHDGVIKVFDELRGEIVFKLSEMEDHVLMKTNGIPTYQFASVVDDYDMKISHVLRGEEWIPSFPKNILLYQSFGWTPPKFIHLPLTLNKGGGKLSKRQGDVAVEDFKQKGYLKESLINFSALLGWSPYSKNPNTSSEVISLNEIVKIFDYHDMGTSPAVFDVEKLDYLNGYYIRQKNMDELFDLCLPYLEENLNLTKNQKKKEKDFIKRVIKTEHERLKVLSDIAEMTKFFFVDAVEYDADLLLWKKLDFIQIKQNLNNLYNFLEKIDEQNWNEINLNDRVIEYLKSNDLKVGDYLWPMRVSLSGQKNSPGPFEISAVLGKNETLERINEAIRKIT